jgi:glycine cleavage system regulatory protein
MDTGGNILDTRAQRLAGDLAIMMLIDLPEQQIGVLSDVLQEESFMYGIKVKEASVQ